MIVTYPFTEEDSQRAYNEWGANCGPNALAFALGVSLDDVRGKIPGFDEKRFTNPTMMRCALSNSGANFTAASGDLAAEMFSPWPALSLVRIQWTGPWTAPGANPKWAYRQTHWIVAWKDEVPAVFDVNGGIMDFEVWKSEVVPVLTAQTPRATGGWFPTHVWRISK